MKHLYANIFSVQPFGVGAPTLHFKSGDQSFGKQNGTDFTIGSYVLQNR
jgi:hypothetical protein